MAMALALTLSMATMQSGGAWYDSTALMQEDMAAGRYFYNGVVYTSQAAYLAAIGGTQSGLTRIFGPRVVDGASEIITNGGFATDTTGWTGRNSGTIASVTAECVLTGNGGATPGFTQDAALNANRGYQLTGTNRRGTSTSSVSLIAASATSLANPAGISASNATTSNVAASITFGAEAATMRVGGRLVGTSTGTGIFDGISLKEAEPYKGWVPGVFAGSLSFTTPSASGATRYLMTADSDTTDNTSRDRNRFMCYYNSSNQIIFVVTYAGASQTFATIDTVALDTPCKIAWSVTPDMVIVSLNGLTAAIDTTATFPGVTLVRFGRNANGGTFDGTFSGYNLYNRPLTSAEAENTTGASSSAIACWGDSLTAGPVTVADKYPTQAIALFAQKRAINNQGFGGQTSTQIAARMGVFPILCNVTGQQIPASGGVAVPTKSINVLSGAGLFLGTQIGTMAGVRGTMSTDGSGNWTFTRDTAGTAAACPDGTEFIPQLVADTRQRTQWTWLGRNGADSGHTVEGDIAAAIASMNHSRFLVGSTLTSSLDTAPGIATIQARNASLASTYGAKFVDVLTALQAANDGSANDLADVAAGYTPRSLRSDDLHLNAAGYAIVAAQFYAAHIANGYP